MPNSAPTIQTKRSNLVDLKYETIYGLLADYAQAELAKRRADALSQYALLKYFTSALWAVAIRNGVGNLRNMDIVPACHAYNGEPTEWTVRGMRTTGTVHELDTAQSLLYAQTFAQHLPADCELVLDLGCGWGHRMFDLWSHGGPQRARYVGGDRSLHSRELVLSVAKLFPGINVDWMRFDFLNPSFDHVSDMPVRKIGVYSCQAIEQTTALGSRLFDELFKTFPHAEIHGVHLEPVGFQAADSRILSYVDARFANDAGLEKDRNYAIDHEYNLDLYQQLVDHPRIQIEKFEINTLDFPVGISTSLITWTST